MLFTSSALLVASAFVQQSLAAQVQGNFLVNNKSIALNTDAPFYRMRLVASPQPDGVFNVSTQRCHPTNNTVLSSQLYPGRNVEVAADNTYYVFVGHLSEGGVQSTANALTISCDTKVGFVAGFGSSQQYFTGDREYVDVEGAQYLNGRATATVTFIPSDPASRCFYSKDPRAATCSATYAPLTCTTNFIVKNGACSCPDGSYASASMASCAPCKSTNAATCDNTGTLTSCKALVALDPNSPDAASCASSDLAQGSAAGLLGSSVPRLPGLPSRRR